MRVESSSVKAFSRPCQGLCAAFISALLLPLTLGAQTTQAHYIWKNVIIRGGGFVSGIVFSPAQKGLVYARTDVGGAYRSDDAGEHWIPLTDAFTREQSTYHGIESLAVDPTDPNKVYLAAGMYSADWGGPAGILRSSDKGRNWTLAPLPLKMGGNDDGRNCGEKLAVDPNLPSVLYFGSRKAGLWRSRDSGATWSKVESFPVKEKVPEPWTQVGITFVLFDQTKGAKGAATPSIYVGVAQAGASLYRSDDAGGSWHVVPGLPTKMFPSHAKLDPAGSIYFSFINNIGPNGITDGAIMKYSTADGKLADITPVKPGSGSDGRKYGFGGIGIDPQHPETIMVTTLDRWWPSDNIYRSTDGGKHWKELDTDAQFSAPNVPWVYWHRDKTGGTGWMSDIEIDPFNPSKVMYTTGEGIWGSADVTEADRGKPTHWGFPNDGLEEVVPIALISPTEGAHLLSGVGDIGGFRHDDLTKSPAGGFFDDPRFTNTDSLDYATQKPSLIVRVGRGGEKIVHGAYSTDGGTKWHEFASEPPTSKFGSGHVAISSDGAVVVWTPERGRAFWTDNMGKNWTPTGLSDSVDFVSDRVNPNKFYAFDKSSGTLYESEDKAKTFRGRGGPPGGHSRGAFLIAAPSKDGDIWLAAAANLYHSTDSGGHFTTVEEMHKVYQLGFGKAAAGQSYPAMYLAGEWKGKDAIYRSDDAGRSWVPINDDAHQYGWIGPITGDPRVYGRVYFGTGGRGVIYGDLAGEAAAGSAGGH